MKVIFLDIDGVLNYKKWRLSQSKFSRRKAKPIDERKVKLLSYIIKKTKAKIVLSSSWRFIMNKECFKMKSRAYKVHKIFNKYKIRIADMTGNDFIGNDKSVWGRGYEILSYLEKHSKIKKYAVVDDAVLELQTFNKEHLFLTDYNKDGLNEKIAQSVISYLNS